VQSRIRVVEHLRVPAPVGAVVPGQKTQPDRRRLDATGTR
jgi:hypothetical protein